MTKPRLSRDHALHLLKEMLRIRRTAAIPEKQQLTAVPDRRDAAFGQFGKWSGKHLARIRSHFQVLVELALEERAEIHVT